MTRARGGLGISLRAARQLRGVSVAEFAEQIGVSAERLRDIEAGNSRPGVDVVLGAALAYDITPDELLGAAPEDRDIGRLLANLPRLRQIYRLVRSR